MIFAAATVDEESPFRYTEAEAAMVGRLALVRARADRGDRRAKAQIAGVARQLAGLKRRARHDVRAARAARVLEESGLFVSSQTFTMPG